MNPTSTPSRATLIVIDVQPLEFKAARHPDLQRGVASLVRKAIARNWDIVVVEYKGAGSTIPEVTEQLRDYDRTDTVIKNTDGGGEEVWLAMAHNSFAGERIFVCGTNTHGCVQDTVDELAELLDESDIAVVKSGCNDGGGNFWNTFDCAKNVRVVGYLPAA
jgi:nicotinamidase-related amidase